MKKLSKFLALAEFHKLFRIFGLKSFFTIPIRKSIRKRFGLKLSQSPKADNHFRFFFNPSRKEVFGSQPSSFFALEISKTLL